MKFSRVRVLVGATLLAAACGAQDDTLPGSAADTAASVEAAAAGDTAAGVAGVTSIGAVLTEWEITLSQDSVPAGPVTIGVSNEGTIPHAFEIEGNGEEFVTDRIEAGESVTMSVDLSAGEYKVYCPVDSAGTNHEAMGMVTSLRVY